MKKLYINPQIEIVKVEVANMVCISGDENGGSAGMYSTKMGAGSALSRGDNDWDDED